MTDPLETLFLERDTEELWLSRNWNKSQPLKLIEIHQLAQDEADYKIREMTKP